VKLVSQFKNVLRVLVVANPTGAAPSKAGRLEGEVVASIFEDFAIRTRRRIEVVRVFGSLKANRAAVLKKLKGERFDVLHFASHGLFDDPKGMVWLGKATHPVRTLAPEELFRGGHVPSLIFLNACASSEGPNDSGPFAARKFAESFLSHGVANFICTDSSWDDATAVTFCSELYSNLLGSLATENLPDALSNAVSVARAKLSLSVARHGKEPLLLYFATYPLFSESTGIAGVARVKVKPSGGAEHRNRKPILPTGAVEVIAPTADLREDTGRLSTKRLSRLYGVSLSEFAAWIGRSKQSVSKTPNADSLQRVLLPFEGIAQLRIPLGSDQAFRKWLRVPNRLLERQSPLDLISANSTQIVADLAEDMLTGQVS
jgi:CHAT domain/Protein of unknown function (DUF2384)